MIATSGHRSWKSIIGTQTSQTFLPSSWISLSHCLSPVREFSGSQLLVTSASQTLWSDYFTLRVNLFKPSVILDLWTLHRCYIRPSVWFIALKRSTYISLSVVHSTTILSPSSLIQTHFLPSPILPIISIFLPILSFLYGLWPRVITLVPSHSSVISSTRTHSYIFGQRDRLSILGRIHPWFYVTGSIRSCSASLSIFYSSSHSLQTSFIRTSREEEWCFLKWFRIAKTNGTNLRVHLHVTKQLAFSRSPLFNLQVRILSLNV